MFRKLFLLTALLSGVWLLGGLSAPPAAADEGSLSGTLMVIWVDRPDGPAEQPLFYLSSPAGRPVQLLPGAVSSAELERWAGRPVVVTVGSATETTSAGQPGLAVASIGPAPGAAAPDIEPNPTGTSRWVVLGCKFPDVASVPHPMSYYAGMYRNTFPSLPDYWREVSYGQLNVTGEAFGWFTLPHNQATYFNGLTLEWWEIVTDCTAQADAAVYFPDYQGISFVLNDTITNSAWGGPISWTFDGVTKTYAANWMTRLLSNDMAYFQHEMGHGYRMRHSASAQGDVYGNVWDIMGGAVTSCAANDPVYRCVGQYPAAFHRAHWTIPWLDGRVYEAGPGTHSVVLSPATRPTAAGYQMIRIPIDGNAVHYYTVEARERVGYDAGLPGDAVILYEADDSSNTRPITIVDPCGGPFCDGNSESAMLRVGESLAPGLGGIAVRVDTATPDGYRLTIVNQAQAKHMELMPTADTYVRAGQPNKNFGTETQLLVGANTTITTYLQFGQLPPAVTSVHLQLCPTAPLDIARGGVAATGRYYRGTTTPWTETGLTFNNAPSLNDGGWEEFTPMLAGGCVDWDLWTTQFWNSNFQTLGVQEGAQDIPLATYSSREGATPPRLIVDYLDMPPLDEPTTTTFLPTNDATVTQAKPKLVLGAKPTLQVKDAAKDLNAYLKFNVAGLTGTLHSATLRLYVLDAGPDGGRVYAVSPYYRNTTTQWLETGLNWNTAPTIQGASLATLGPVALRQWVTVDVTAAVAAALTSGTRVSLALSNDSANLVSYSSGEGAQPPELVVVTE